MLKIIKICLNTSRELDNINMDLVLTAFVTRVRTVSFCGWPSPQARAAQCRTQTSAHHEMGAFPLCVCDFHGQGALSHWHSFEVLCCFCTGGQLDSFNAFNAVSFFFFLSDTDFLKQFWNKGVRYACFSHDWDNFFLIF